MDVGEAGYWASSIVINSVEAFVESSNDFIILEGGHVEKATPDFSEGEAAGYNSCDNAKVISTAFKSAPEIGIS